MKRKHKIVIATGVISLSMITAMATGLINTGNLFAEDSISAKSGTLSSVNGDYTTLPLDKLIGFGGDTFLYQNDNIFLRSANVGEGPFAPTTAIDANDAMDYDKSLAKQKAVTYGNSLYNLLNTIEKAYIKEDGKGNYAFIPELAQMSNTRVIDGHLWTRTAGTKTGRIKFVDGNNRSQGVTRAVPEISDTHTCVNPSTKTGIDYYGKIVYKESLSSSVAATPKLYNIKYALNFNNNSWSGILQKSLTAKPLEGDLNRDTCESYLNSGIPYKGCNIQIESETPAYPAVTCNVTNNIEEAGYRPAIELQNLNISMLMDNSSNSPIIDASTEVKMVFNSNDLMLTVTPDSIPLDDEGNLKVGIGDDLKVSYTTSNATGSNSNIIAIYKDESGKKVGYKNLGTAGTGELIIPTNGFDSGELGLGNYTVELYNMVLNGQSESNITSIGTSLSFETFYNLKDNEVTLSGNKVTGTTNCDDVHVHLRIRDYVP